MPGTYASLSETCDVFPSPLYRSLERSVLKSETRHVKLLLTLSNRIERVRFCLSHVNRHNTHFRSIR